MNQDKKKDDYFAHLAKNLTSKEKDEAAFPTAKAPATEEEAVKKPLHPMAALEEERAKDAQADKAAPSESVKNFTLFQKLVLGLLATQTLFTIIYTLKYISVANDWLR